MSNSTETPKRRLWLRVLFAASLALNLLVVGLAAGAALRHGGLRGGPEGHRPPPSLGAVMYRALPHSERKALREVSAGDERAERAKAGGADMVPRMVALLQAADLDEAAVASLLSEETARREAWIAHIQGNLTALVAGMSVDERRAYADRMEEVAQKRSHKGKSGDKSGM